MAVRWPALISLMIIWLLMCLWSGRAAAAAVEGLSVNWGTKTYHRLPPATVAQLLKDNGINKVKLFDVEDYTVEALAGTGIEVMVAVPNLMLASMTDYSNAREWVRENVTRLLNLPHGGIQIKYVAVGNEPFLKDYKKTYTNVTFPALKNIQKALDDAGHGKHIKATVPLNADVYYSPDHNPVPSAGRWRNDVAGAVGDIVRFYNRTGAPFTVNIYPYLSLILSTNFPSEFAFFDGEASPLIDGGFTYTNVFDANHDTLVAALKSEGCGDIPILVGEVGWPTDGEAHANVSNARRFYSGLMKKLGGGEGTPQRPKTELDVYAFGLFDEEEKSILPGPFERSWGIFTTDGRPKYAIAGKMPAAAQAVDYLPKKWCVVNAQAAKNESRLKDNVEYACKNGAECMALSEGGSCSGLDKLMQASYVFNAYFQALGQVEGSCNFDGLAMVTGKNFSQGGCNFGIGFRPWILPTAAPAPAPDAEHSPAGLPQDDSSSAAARFDGIVSAVFVALVAAAAANAGGILLA